VEPLTDLELDHLLRQWEAPAVPESLNSKVLGARERRSRWRFLLTGSIRVPVPLGIATAAVLMLLILLVWNTPSEQPNRSETLRDFKPIRQLEPRIIRSTYEIR